MALRAEECGYGAFFRSDHYLTMGGDGLPGPTDAWITLAGLARETSTIRLGRLVTSATFREPGPLAVAVAQVDQMSGGRIDLGLGAGWFEREHAAYGIPFPGTGTRFDRFAEQLEIITGLWRTPVGETFDFSGEHWQLVGSPALPKPVTAAGPPIVIGGKGPRRTPALAARFADEFNTPFCGPEEAARLFARVRTACEDAGRQRPPVFSSALTLCCGRDDAEVRRRAEAIGRDPDDWGEEMLAGTPGEVVEQVERFAAAGAERLYLQVMDLADLEHLDLVAAEVAPRLVG